MPGYMTPQQQQQLRQNVPQSPLPKPNPNGGVPAFSGPLPPTAAPALPPNPLAGIGTAITKQQSTKPTQPIAFNGGKQLFKPTTAPFGMDMTMPGVYEQNWENNQGLWLQSPQQDWVMDLLPKFQDPWRGENKIAGMVDDEGARQGQEYWEGVRGAGNTPVEDKVGAGYTQGNMAMDAYNRIQGAMPGSLQPQFDKFYDRMHDKAVSDVNSQSAARGAYGSNSSLNNSIGAGLDVEAQRAKASTDFLLADSANQRDWMGLLGGQGSAADTSGVNAYNANIAGAKYGLDKTKTLGDLAFAAEEAELNRDKFQEGAAKDLDDLQRNRLDSGVSTAFGSEQLRQGAVRGAFDTSREVQTARDNRVNNLYSQLSGFSKDVQDFVAQNYDKLLGGDQQMSDQEMEAMIAKTADERGWNEQQTERFARDLKAAVSAASDAKQAGVI